jgi:putative spermidine/putrescine transport system permease protein
MQNILKNKTISGWLMVSPLAVVLLLFLVLPIVMIVAVSFWRATEFSIIPDFDFENYTRSQRGPEI